MLKAVIAKNRPVRSSTIGWKKGMIAS